MTEPAAERVPGNPILRFAWKLIDQIGRVTSLLIFVLIAILLYGVIMRYVFGKPSIWVSELSGLLYACYFLIGGAYAVIHNEHVNVNIFRGKKFSDHAPLITEYVV